MLEPELRDIHLPDPSHWWPPAPGWWLLALLVLAALFALWWRHRGQRPPDLRQHSLLELERIRQRVRQVDENAIAAVALRDVSTLLRRTLISFNGRDEFAASTGERWIEQLGQLSVNPGFNAEQHQLLLRGRYQREIDYDVERLLDACEDWIRGLPAERHRVAD